MTQLTTKKRIYRVDIHPVIRDKIMSNCTEYQSQQSLSKIVNDLLDKSLTQCAILNKPRTEGSEGTKVYSSINKDKEKKKAKEWPPNLNRYSLEKCNEIFEKFWKIYRSAPKGVNSPKKNRAKEEFIAIAKSGAYLENILEGAEIAVRDQKLKIETEGDCLCLPDAFRWLQAEVYNILLEEAATAPQQYNSNTPTIL